MGTRTTIATVALALVLVLVPARLGPLACGGPLSYALEPSLDWLVASSLGGIVTVSDTYDDYPRDELVFLHPAVAASPARLGDLWLAAYGYPWQGARFGRQDTDPVPYRSKPDVTPLAGAITRHDWMRAARVARALVEQILDMPAPQADLHRATFNRALELLELAPFVREVGDEQAAAFLGSWPSSDADGPPLPGVLAQARAVRAMDRGDAGRLLEADPKQARAATLRFLVLGRALHEQIPDGWRRDIKESTPKETWTRLEGLVDAWLADFPSHPLADLVRLLKVRLYYFQERSDAAFDVLLEMYARHPARALYEMRFLVQQDFVLDLSAPVAARVPPEVLTGFVPRYATNYQTDRLWQLSLDHPDAAWATNLQERLLVRAADDPTHLPAWFPSVPAAPTQLWGDLRLYLLVKNERWDEAERQVAVMKPDATTGLFVARIALARGDVWGAMRGGLSEPARQYVIRVLLRDDELRELAAIGTTWERHEALLSLGVRVAAAGDWRGAADLVRATDPARARLWDACRALAAADSPAGRLRWARFLVAHRGQLFYSESGPWYRSLNGRWRRAQNIRNALAAGGYQAERAKAISAPIRPEWTPDFEHDAVGRHLLHNEMWLALETYVGYLERVQENALREPALHEADDAYNHLLNYTSDRPHFWGDQLETADVVGRLRAIGRQVRAADGPGVPPEPPQASP